VRTSKYSIAYIKNPSGKVRAAAGRL